MKLNTQYRNDLRTYVVTQIQGLCEKGEFPEGTRVKLDKNLLEELLFEIKKDENGQEYKEIIWGMRAGLDKIDLSDISFDNVNWELDYLLNLSNSNASIKFKNAYRGKKGVVVSHVDFENVPLSKSNADAIDSAHNCSFKGTKIKLTPFTPTTMKRFTQCDFTGVDLHESVLTSFQILVGNPVDCFKGSIFKNTGIHIEMTNLVDHQNSISRMIHDGDLAGCYVNGVYILDAEQSKQKANDMLSEYRTYVDNYREGIEKAIEEVKLHKTK